MGLFRKKSKITNDAIATPSEQQSASTARPSGWIYENHILLEKISSEQSYFLKLWAEHRYSHDVKLRYSSTKSYYNWLIQYKAFCEERGPHFAKWYTDIIADDDYIDKIYKEMKYTEENADFLFRKQKLLTDLENQVLTAITSNPDILQKDFYKLFDDCIKLEVRDCLYHLDKDGKIRRTKKGSTYILDLL